VEKLCKKFPMWTKISLQIPLAHARIFAVTKYLFNKEKEYGR